MRKRGETSAISVLNDRKKRRKEESTLSVQLSEKREEERQGDRKERGKKITYSLGEGEKERGNPHKKTQ